MNSSCSSPRQAPLAWMKRWASVSLYSEPPHPLALAVAVFIRAAPLLPLISFSRFEGQRAATNIECSERQMLLITHPEE
jgi:hypothetical protein